MIYSVSKHDASTEFHGNTAIVFNHGKIKMGAISSQTPVALSCTVVHEKIVAGHKKKQMDFLVEILLRFQTCETSADSRNSAAGLLSQAVYVISVNSRRKSQHLLGGGGLFCGPPNPAQ